MKLLLLLFLAASLTSAEFFDRPCDRNPANFWLDIVIVVDNSRCMTNQNLDLVVANIVDTFGSGTRIGTNYADPRSTRVGLVTYGQEATIAADLNKYQSAHDLFKGAHDALSGVQDTDESYLFKGLQAAEQVLSAGRSNNYRGNYKQMIIVYAATYQGTNQTNPVIVADRLKNNGVNIAVVDMIQYDGSRNYEKLKAIATQFMFYDYGFFQGEGVRDSLYRTNCFCRSSWTQYLDAVNIPYGDCLQVSSQTTNWFAAKLACQNSAPKAYLVTDSDRYKHKFVQSMFQNITGSTSGYHIGLNFLNGDWYWQQALGQPLVKLSDINRPDDILWYKGYPKTASSNTGVAYIADMDGAGWENINPYNNNQYYICQVNACDTENYCS